MASGVTLPTENEEAYAMVLATGSYAFLMDSSQLQYKV